jgi:prepilin-type N-terminal cleavage/methylation domain-containing protein
VKSQTFIRGSAPLKKTMHPSVERPRHGFTLVELLVVIGIIGVVAGLIYPAVATTAKKSKILQARTDISELNEAIRLYQQAYSGRFPVSTNTLLTRVNGQYVGPLDFTFGTIDVTGSRVMSNRFGRPLTLVSNSLESATGLSPFEHQANNSEVMSILLAATTFDNGNGLPTVNQRHQYNPLKRIFTKAIRVPGAASHGVGDDLVFRDPWGNPYIITLDLSQNGVSTDAFYRMAHVTETLPSNNNTSGLRGLLRMMPPAGGFRQAPTAHPGDRHGFYIRDTIAVWSFGPDGRANYNGNNSPDHKANEGDNKDNILSWIP